MRKLRDPLVIQVMRARRKLWHAGHYLEKQYNANVSRGADEIFPQVWLLQAINIIADRYNSLIAN